MYKNENKIKLLLVDDEKEFLDSAAHALGRRDVDVVAASNGNEALDAVGKHAFDVAVVDVKMPGIDGIELFRR